MRVEKSRAMGGRVADLSAMTQFQSSLDRAPAMSVHEERALFTRWTSAGDETAREEILRRSLRFVWPLAEKAWRQSPGVAFEDFVAEGNMALIEAFERFDVAVGARFLTFAESWVRRRLGELAGDLGGAVRVPVDRLKQFHQLRRAENIFQQRSGRLPTCAEVARLLGWSAEVVESTRATRQKHGVLAVSLSDYGVDERLSPEDLGVDAPDLIPDSVGVADQPVLDLLADVLLPEQYLVLVRYFGLDGAPEETFETIAEWMPPVRGDQVTSGLVLRPARVSREHVRRTYLATVSRLKASPAGQRLEAMLRARAH